MICPKNTGRRSSALPARSRAMPIYRRSISTAPRSHSSSSAWVPSSAKEILPTRLVEIIVVTVSKINECPYCTVHHSNRAVELGMSAETLENILEQIRPGSTQKKNCPRLCKPRSRAAMGHPRPSLCGYENISATGKLPLSL